MLLPNSWGSFQPHILGSTETGLAVQSGGVYRGTLETWNSAVHESAPFNQGSHDKMYDFHLYNRYY